MKQIDKGNGVAIISAPFYRHNGAVCYLNALLTYLGCSTDCWDLEYTLEKEDPASIDLLKSIFSTYESGSSGIDFIRRPLFILKSLFPGAWKSADPDFDDNEEKLLKRVTPFIKKMTRKILERRKQTLIFTTLNGNLWFSLLMIHTLRQMGFRGKIVIGGEGISHPRSARLARELSIIDYVVESKYFQAFSDLLNFLGLENLQPDDILAMIEKNKLHPLLEGFPEPGLDFRSYWSVPITAKQFIPLFGTFGCRYNCNFCFDSTASFYRQRSPGSVVQEIKGQMRRYGFRIFGFCDSNLNSDPEWLKELCRTLLAEKIDAWFTFAHLRADKIDEETIDLIQRCGFRNVNLGVESFNHAMCRQMNKGYRQEKDVSTVIDQLALAKIPMSINIFSSYPGHTEDHFRETMAKTAEVAARLTKKDLLDYVVFSVHPTRFDPHSRLYNDMLRYRVRKIPFHLPDPLKHLQEAVEGVMESHIDSDPVLDEQRLGKMRKLVEHIKPKTFFTLTPEMGVLTPASRLKFKPDLQFQYTREAEGYLEIKNNRGDVLRVSETGQLIFSLLMKNNSIKEIVDTLWGETKGRNIFYTEVQKFALGLISEGIAVLMEETT